MFGMEYKSQELKSTLTGQIFEPVDNYGLLLEEAKSYAMSFVKITEGIAVLSDFSDGVCHTYSGKFGIQMFSLPAYLKDEKSAFEDIIFDSVPKEDLMERHILELRFFNFLQNVPKNQRTAYLMSCAIRFHKPDGTTLPILHTSRYIQWNSTGSVWLGLCTFTPLPLACIEEERGITNVLTGKLVDKNIYTKNDRVILSKRQSEILFLLSKGYGSKQIADKLNISVHTVNRHRQDILSALKVSNSASAVEIGLRLRLI